MSSRPLASSVAALKRMRNQRAAGTKPEVELRRALHSMGLRFRVERTLIPGSRKRADIVFVRAKVVVLVHGCFWHACPLHGTSPIANADWWQRKLAANVERDKATRDSLLKLGWQVIEVWEHESSAESAERVAKVVRMAPLPVPVRGQVTAFGTVRPRPTK